MKPRPRRGGQDVRDLIERFKSVDYIMHRKLWQKLGLKLKPGHVMMMVRLRRASNGSPDGLRVSELASLFNVTAPGVTQAVTALERQGYVARKMDPEDRRAVRVSLTESGRREAQAMRAAVDTVFTGLVKHLGREKSRRLLALLTEVTRYFEGQDAPEASTAEEIEGRS